MPDIDTLIHKYTQGGTDENENRILAEWLHESPENRKKLFNEKDIWDAFGYHTDQKRYKTDEELKILRLKLTDRTTSYYSLSVRILRVAAVLIIVFGLGWATRYISFEKPQAEMAATIQKIVVPKGQINQVFLADGTRIWINSQSKVSIPSIFAPNERVVQLSGEAFFEVAKDARRPFKVEVNGQRIEVLGTSFNVRAYPNERGIQTTLSTGKIQLFALNQHVVLNAGEQSNYNQTTQKLTVNKVDPTNFNSWKEGGLNFRMKIWSKYLKSLSDGMMLKSNSTKKILKGCVFQVSSNETRTYNIFLTSLTILSQSAIIQILTK